MFLTFFFVFFFIFLRFYLKYFHLRFLLYKFLFFLLNFRLLSVCFYVSLPVNAHLMLKGNVLYSKWMMGNEFILEIKPFVVSVSRNNLFVSHNCCS